MTINSQKPTVTFVKVANTQAKLLAVCSIVQRHYEQGDTLLVMVSGRKASTYVDELLWRSPKDSFVPHVIAEDPCTDAVAITTSSNNLNAANVILNLKEEELSLDNEIEQLYELFDTTTSIKETSSTKKAAFYKENGYVVNCFF